MAEEDAAQMLDVAKRLDEEQPLRETEVIHLGCLWDAKMGFMMIDVNLVGSFYTWKYGGSPKWMLFSWKIASRNG